MKIKSSQTLVTEALKSVKTISPKEALQLSNENKCNLIDIRDLNELQKNLYKLKNYLPTTVDIKENKIVNLFRCFSI